MFGVERYTFSEAALRDGVLVDTVSRMSSAVEGTSGTLHHLRDVSRRSIAQLAERCDDDPAHSAHVARLALALFDELAPLHGLDATAREYLEAGALLANVGLVVAHSKHHLHAYYVIRNSELAGLTDLEIEIIAQIARYHRKSEPKSSHAEFASLGAGDQALVRTLAGILRVAISLDRSHERPGTWRAGGDPGQARRGAHRGRPGRRHQPRALRGQRAQVAAGSGHRPPRRAAPGPDARVPARGLAARGHGAAGPWSSCGGAASSSAAVAVVAGSARVDGVGVVVAWRCRGRRRVVGVAPVERRQLRRRTPPDPSRRRRRRPGRRRRRAAGSTRRA